MKLGLGKTGRFPDGKISEDDEGELQLAVTRDRNGLVHINFGIEVAWLALPPAQAVELAKAICRYAGATMEIKL